jgi:small-conductance mechanosensitive channel
MLAAVDIANSVQQALNNLLGFLPNIIGFLLILAIGWVVARLVKAAATKLLQKLGLDRALHDSDAGRYVERVSPGASPSRLIGVVAYWFIFLFALSVAISALKIPALTGFLNQVQNYLPNIIAAVLILVVAAALAGVLGGAVHKLMGDTPTGRMVRAIVPGLILAIAVFMVLTQLHIAPAIVTITYTALLALLVLAGGLAFGLGGRDVAADMWRNAYESGQRSVEQARLDARLGRERAGEQADRVRSNSGDATGEQRPGSRRA